MEGEGHQLGIGLGDLARRDVEVLVDETPNVIDNNSDFYTWDPPYFSTIIYVGKILGIKYLIKKK